MPGKRNILLSVMTQVTVSVVLLAVAGGIAAMLWRTRPQPPMIDEPPRLRRVEVMKALAVPVRRQWQGFGTARARDEADIPAEVTAVVIDIPPQIVEGAQIAKGDVVALLDDTDFVIQQQIAAQRILELTARLEQLGHEESSWTRRVELAAEHVRLAEADFERVTEALQRQAARDREVDQSREKLLAAIRVEVMAREQLDKIGPRRAELAAMKSLQASSLRLAEKNVQRCTIRSPLNGFVATVDIEIGESLAPGQRVSRVVNLDRMEVPLRLPSSARLGVTVGDEVVLNAQDDSTPPWHGEVSRISPLDDQNTRTMTVYVEIDQDPFQPGWLAPGRFVDGRVISRRTEMRYVVPRRSLLGERLLVIEDGTVRSRPVSVDFHVQGDFEQLGVSAEQWAVLADSLDEGLEIVINAARSLPDGLRVEPVSMRSDHRDQRASRHAELSE